MNVKLVERYLYRNYILTSTMDVTQNQFYSKRNWANKQFYTRVQDQNRRNVSLLNFTLKKTWTPIYLIAN